MNNNDIKIVKNEKYYYILFFINGQLFTDKFTKCTLQDNQLIMAMQFTPNNSISYWSIGDFATFAFERT